MPDSAMVQVNIFLRPLHPTDREGAAGVVEGLYPIHFCRPSEPVKDRYPRGAGRFGIHSPEGSRVRKYRFFRFASVLPIIAFTGFLAWFAHSWVEKEIRHEVGQALTNILQTTQQATHSWSYETMKHSLIWARQSHFRQSVLELLAVPPERGNLSASSSQTWLRHWFSTINTHGFRDYFILDRNNINIASSRDAVLGGLSPLTVLDKLFEKVWRGESALTMPMTSSTFHADGMDAGAPGEGSIFSGSPILDDSGKVVAALWLEIDPAYEFLPLIRRRRIGDSGETYAFDRHGTLISESRFDEQLRQLQIISPGQTSQFNLQLHVPKSNTPLDRMPFTRMAQSALAGNSGMDLDGYADYRGVEVVGAWLWDDEFGFGLATEEDVAQAFVGLHDAELSIYTAAAITAALMSALALIFIISRDKIAEREARLRAILETTVDAIITIGEHGHIRSFNSAAEKLFGYSEEVVLGQDISLLIADPTREQLDAHLWYSLDNGHEESIAKGRELCGRRKDGHLFPIELGVSETSTAREKLFTGIIRDISKRKASETALRKAREELEMRVEDRTAQLRLSEKRFRDFAQTASDSLWELDAELRFIYLSDEDQEFHDALNTQFLGKKPWEVFDTSTDPDSASRIIEALKAHQPLRHLDFQVRLPNGRIRHIRTNGEPVFDADGVFAGYRGANSDITELRRAEQRLRDAIESIPDAFVLWDSEDRLVLCNENYREYYRTIRDLLKPGARFAELLRQSVELGQYNIEGDCEEGVEERLRQHRLANDQIEQSLSDGRWLLVSERRTADGGNVGIHSDITARKIAEKALQDRETQLRSLVENLPGFIFRRRLDQDGDFTYDYINGMGIALPEGHPIREMKHTPERLKSLFHPEDRDVIHERITQSAANMLPLSMEHRLKLENGETRWVHSVSSPRRDENGDVIWDGFSLDVTDLKSAEQALQRSQNRFRDFAETSSDWLWETGPDHRFIYISERYSKISGIPLEQLLGKSRLEFYADLVSKAPEKWNRHWRDLEAKRPFRDFEIEMTKGDGAKACYRINGKAYYDDNGDFGGYRGTGFDVTERKLAQEALKQSTMELQRHRDNLQELVDEQTRDLRTAMEAAKAAAKAKSDFLSVISHEVRTPLTGIIGMSDILLREADNDDQVAKMEIVRNSAVSLKKILDDVLDFSRSEAGALSFEEVDFDLAPLMDEVVNLFMPEVKKKGLQIASDILPDPIPLLRGDPSRVKQILLNLVGNAVKFTDMGSIHIRVTEARRKFEYIRLRCEVSDTGIGISQEAQRQLFQPFSQADASVSRKYGGTGLGLAICRTLCQLMGGEIGIRSREGEGTTFWFELELKSGLGEETELTVEDSCKPSPLLKPLDILLAEDHETNRMIVTSVLEGMGHHVDTAEDGLDALITVQRRNFDLILMDMQMPRMGGAEATRKIRALVGYASRTPIIALTADAINEHRKDFIEAGVDEIVTKPIDWNLLQSAMVRCATGRPVPLEPARKHEVAPPANIEAAVVDWERLNRLKALGDEALFQRMSEVFTTSLDRSLEALRAAHSSKNSGQLGREAHKLKGTAGNFGAMAIHEIAKGLQERVEDPASTARNLHDLARAIEATKKALSEISTDPPMAADRAQGT